jgi:hypothetical protein
MKPLFEKLTEPALLFGYVPGLLVLASYVLALARLHSGIYF